MPLYEQIPNINLPININLQIYNTPTINLNYLDIEVILISQKELYYTKLNPTYINKYNKKIRSKFDPILLASNIYLTAEDMESFNIENDLYLIISMSKSPPYNSFDNEEDDKLIIGTTIFQKNSLIYPSERIYHYGELNKEEKIVYKLKGKPEYHLMRLEFGSNSDLIEWTVKRTNDNDICEKSVFLPINSAKIFVKYSEYGRDSFAALSAFFTFEAATIFIA